MAQTVLRVEDNKRRGRLDDFAVFCGFMGGSFAFLADSVSTR